MTTLPPSQKLALRNLAHMGATARDVAAEAAEAGVSAVALTHLVRAGLAEKAIEKRPVGRHPQGRPAARVQVTIYWLTDKGVATARSMDA